MPIMLAVFSNAYAYLLFSKLCWHNNYLPNPIGRTLSSGKQFYTHEMYSTDQEPSNLHIIFLMPLVEDKDPKRAFRDKMQLKFINEIGIMEVVQISLQNKETVIYSKYTHNFNRII